MKITLQLGQTSAGGLLEVSPLQFRNVIYQK